MDDEPRGTFACPICGQDTPHHHSEEVVAAYRDDQVRRDGWISTLVRVPNDMVGRFYLCRGHKLEPGPLRDEDGAEDFRARAIHGLLWERRMGHMMDAEVLQWDQMARSFMLAQWVGPPTISSEDRRSPIYVRPTHWRPLPAFNVANDTEALATHLGGLEAVLRDLRDRYNSLRINSEAERERLIRELGEARAASGVNETSDAARQQGNGGVER